MEVVNSGTKLELEAEWVECDSMSTRNVVHICAFEEKQHVDRHFKWWSVGPKVASPDVTRKQLKGSTRLAKRKKSGTTI